MVHPSMSGIIYLWSLRPGSCLWSLGSHRKSLQEALCSDSTFRPKALGQSHLQQHPSSIGCIHLS
eukprot:11351_4